MCFRLDCRASERLLTNPEEMTWSAEVPRTKSRVGAQDLLIATYTLYYLRVSYTTDCVLMRSAERFLSSIGVEEVQRMPLALEKEIFAKPAAGMDTTMAPVAIGQSNQDNPGREGKTAYNLCKCAQFVLEGGTRGVVCRSPGCVWCSVHSGCPRPVSGKLLLSSCTAPTLERL